VSKKKPAAKKSKRTPVIYPDRDEVFLARGKAAGRASHSLGDGWRPEDATQ
jgi:hypothetical protein